MEVCKRTFLPCGGFRTDALSTYISHLYTLDLAQCFIGELLRFGISLILPSNTFIPSTEKLASYSE